MKKLFSLIILVVICASLAACGNTTSTSSTTSSASAENASIAGYYRYIAEQYMDGTLADKEYITDFLEPKYGSMYFEIFPDDTAVLMYYGNELHFNCEQDKQMFIEDYEKDPIEFSYSFDGQLLTLKFLQNENYKYVFERSERPETSPEIDLDVFEFGDLTIYAPAELGLQEDPSADIPEDTFWRRGSVALLVNRYDLETNLDMSQEELLDRVYEGTKDSINGRYYVFDTSKNDDGTEYFYISTVMKGEKTFWLVSVWCLPEDKDVYKDSMVKMMDWLEVRE